MKHRIAILAVLIIPLLVCAAVPALSQTQMRHWYFPGSYIDFTVDPPTVNALGGPSTGSASNGICDETGQTLFYIIDLEVFDKNGVSMGSIYGPNTMIVQMPYNKSRFYIFQCDPGAGIWYDIVDMGLNDGDGALIELVEEIDLVGPNHMALAKISGDEYWLYYNTGAEIKRVTVGSTISSPTTIVDHVIGGEYQYYPGGEFELVKLAGGNWRLAGTTRPNCHPDLSRCCVTAYVIDLDSNGEYVDYHFYPVYDLSSPYPLQMVCSGLEFSLDGSKLFASHMHRYGPSDPAGVYWLNLSDPSPSWSFIPGSYDYRCSQLERARNGYIYAASSSNILAGINMTTNTIDPSAEITGVNVTPTSQSCKVFANQIDNYEYDIAEPSECIIVDPLGGGDYLTIQEAVTAALPGDHVCLVDATYTGANNRDIVVDKDITIRSISDYPNACVIDCEGTSLDEHRGFWFQTGATSACHLEGIKIINGHYHGGALAIQDASPTIINCIFDNNEGFPNSGAAVIYTNSDPTFINCRITNNYGNSRAGAMLTAYDSNPTFMDCIFSGNYSDDRYAGALLIYGDATLTGCTFSGNTAVEEGGAIYCDVTTVIEHLITLQNCSFISNSSDIRGGAIYLNGHVRLEATGCTFQDNTAPEGGGVYSWNDESLASTSFTSCDFISNVAVVGGGIACNDYSAATFTDCQFTSNEADTGGAAACTNHSDATFDNCTFSNNMTEEWGGGMYISYSSPGVTDCIFSNNSADLYGGGLIVYGPSANPSVVSPTIQGCTFDYNASQYGGAINCYWSSPTILECTLDRNGATAFGGGIFCFMSNPTVDFTNITFSTDGEGIFCNLSGPVIDNSNVYGNADGDIVGCPGYLLLGPAQTCNISADPLYCHLDGDLEYAVDDDSPCLPGNNACGVLIGASGVGCSEGMAAVALSSFAAMGYEDYVEIEWSTAAEIGNAGFNIHRAAGEESDRARINTEIIPAEGGELEGHLYSFTDHDIEGGVPYVYWIEDIDIEGRSTMHGPLPVTMETPSYAFKVNTNYPNPFNPATTISFSLPAPTEITLRIYDVSGRLVKTLADAKPYRIGEHEIVWDGRNGIGALVDSGVYFYRLDAKQNSTFGKMILVR